jgi:malate synthase
MISSSTKNIYSVVDLRKNVPFNYKQVLSCKALKFVADLHLNFNDRRMDLLTLRDEERIQSSAGNISHFLFELRMSRNEDGRITNLMYEFKNRRIEIISPAERDLIKEYISFNSNLLIVDFEDTIAPTWEKLIEGQINLKDVVNSSILNESPDFEDSETLVEKIVPILVRPRSLKSNEKNLFIDNEPVAAAFFDLGLFIYHNAKKLVDQGFVPYFYLPEISNHLEADLWNDIFGFIEEEISLPFGTIKAAA